MKTAIFVATLSLTTLANGECYMPELKLPVIPDGKTTNMQAMTNAYTESLKLVSKGEEFISCLDSTKNYVLAKDMMRSYTLKKISLVANNYNKQLSVYKSVNEITI